MVASFPGLACSCCVLSVVYAGRMTDDAHLTAATAAEIAESLSFGLLYNGRKRVHDADSMMARITAQRLVEHLERAGFVLMKRPPTQPHSV